MTPKQLYDFYFNDLKWCGCGDPTSAMEFMRDVLAAIQFRSQYYRANEAPSPLSEESRAYYEAANTPLVALLPDNSQLGLAYQYVLDAHELTEHGGNVCGAWLTTKGTDVLESLREHGCDINYWELYT